MSFSIRRDVEGVEGLHIACNVFSQDLERRLFQGQYPHAVSPRQRMPGRLGGCATLMIETYTREVWEVINAVRDCGLFSELQTPDSGYLQTYHTDHQALPPHYDGENMFGETVLGISLGAGCLLIMTPDQAALPGRRAVDILLPRRSIYVLSGSARYSPGWQHSINSVGIGSEQIPLPSWNPEGVRRSITMRSTIIYSMVLLQREKAALPAAAEAQRASLHQRLNLLHSQGLHPGVEKGWGREVTRAAHLRRTVLASSLAAARMPVQDAMFLDSLPPELAALYRGGQPAEEAAVHQPRQEQLEASRGSPSREAKAAAGAAGSSRKLLWAAADPPVQQQEQQQEQPGQKRQRKEQPGEEGNVVCLLSGSEGE